MKKVSLITVSYNSASTIGETIESVLSQDYPNIEHIIIDGQSSDGTQAVINQYTDRISHYQSRPDNGLYDAMNKGLALATGDIVGILNSDDVYYDSTVISTVVKEFESAKVDCVFGDLYYFRTGKPDQPVRYYRGKNFEPKKIALGILPPHPTFFVKKELYENLGIFDTTFTLAADFDLMSRFLFVHKAMYSYIPKTLVKMRLGGLSTSSFNRIIEINREDLASCKKNGIKTNLLLFHFKYFFKILEIRNPFNLLGNK